MPECGISLGVILSYLKVQPRRFEAKSEIRQSGRVEVRNVLYMSTLVETRYSPLIQSTVSGIVQKGEGEEDGSDRVYAQFSNDIERDDARQNSVQADAFYLRRIGFSFK